MYTDENISQKIGGIVYDRGGKPSNLYPHLEPDHGLRNRVRVPGSGYKSSMSTNNQ